MATQLVPIEESGLSLYRTPEQALQEAAACARALGNVMAKKKNPVFFPDGAGGKEQYLEAEDWQTVAYFYGHTAKVVETEHVDYGDWGKGFKAAAVLLDRNGSEVSRAEAMCLNTEENWGLVTEYGWEDVLNDQGQKIWDPNARQGKGGYKARRVEVGKKPKPAFQLLSMAETRAICKVISSKFRWVAVLGGYGATPAEEMTGNEFEPETEKTTAPPPPDVQRKSVKSASPADALPPFDAPTPARTQPPPQEHNERGGAPAPQQQASGEVISERQGKMFFAISRSAGLPDDEVKRRLAGIGYTGHRDQIPRHKFQEALAAIDPDFRFHARDQGR